MAKRGKLRKNKPEKNQIERPVRFRKYEYLFLIVCEDENTEKVYFNEFKKQIPEGKQRLYLKAVGTGRDPKGVVEQAIVEKKQLEIQSKKEVDEVWVVFDKDDADFNEARVERFNQAFSISKKENFKIAYSNEVFELWLLLHLIEVDSKEPIPRKEIYQLLQSNITNHPDHIDFQYEHGKSSILEKIRLIGNENKAILRAEKLLEEQKHLPPIEANPSTKVHLLIKEIYSWITYFSFNPKEK